MYTSRPIPSIILALFILMFGLTQFSPARADVDGASFASKVDFNAGSLPLGIAIGDLDGDGKPELVSTSYVGNTVSVLRNTSTSGMINASSFSTRVGFNTGSFPYGVAIGDLDGDGKPDLAVTSSGSNTVSVFRNTSTSGVIDASSFATKVDFSTGNSPYGVAISDLDQDGKFDLAVANFGGSISVLRNTSTSGVIDASSFANKVDFGTGSGTRSLAISDLDGDSKPDLAVANSNMATVSVLRNTSTSGTIDNTSFAAKVDFGTGANAFSVAIGDLDGDIKPDLVVANYYDNTVSVLRNTSVSGLIDNSSFAAKVDFGAVSNPRGVAIGDLDGDARSDLVIANTGSNVVSILRNTSTSGITDISSFAPKVDFNAGSNPALVAIGELDGDGKPDIAALSGSNYISVLQNVTIPPPNTRYVATTGADTSNCSSSSSPCATIIYAISQAATGNTIEIAAGTYTEFGITVDRDLTLSGAGASTTTIQAASNVNLATDRVFLINNGVTATIQGITIKNGHANHGGGIRNDGELSLNNSIVSGNLTTYGAGGILSSVTMTINNSTVSGNTANLQGGGVVNTGSMTLNNSTVSGNTANGYGYYGGGILSTGILLLNNSTVNGNITSGNGGGIANLFEVTLRNTIVAGNSAAFNGTDCLNLNPLASQGYNLIGNNSGCTFISSTGDQVGTSSNPINALLGPLQNNGGQTFTQSLLAGSPALDQIPNGTNNCGVTPFDLDQRGEARPFNTNCDIGAYEAQSTPPTTTPLIVTADAQTKTYGDPDPTSFTFTYSGFVNGDDETDIDTPPICDVSVAHHNVGTYPIACSSGADDNYTATYVDGTLSITPQSLVITPDDKTKIYGDVFTAFTGTITGLQPGDNITAGYASAGAVATAVVGTYPISVTLNDPGGVLGNYNVIINTGSLNVTHHDMIITPDDKTKVYGNFFTAFTGTITGVQAGDNITANYTSPGTPAGADVGTYPISATLNDPSNKLDNYNVILNMGTLIVSHSILTVTAESKIVTYSDPDPAFTLTYSGFVVGDTSAVIDTPPTCTVAGPHTGVGTYPIVCSGGVDNDYIFNYLTGTLTVLSNVPDLLAPANAEQLLNNQPTFDWTDVSGALSYTIQIFNNIGFTGSPTSNTVTPSTYTQPTNLPAGVTRYWRVQATTGAGAGPWSAIRSFVTARPPSTPRLTSPGNNALVTNYTPLLDWNDSTIPAGTTFLKYELQVATDSGFTSPTSTDVAAPVTNSTYKPGTDLNSNTTYYWRARAYNTLGQYSAWSNVRNFRTALLSPVLVTPAEAAQMLVNRPTFEWDDIAGVTGYRIQISNSIGFTSTLTNTVVTSSTYTRTTDLPFGTTLYWRVQSNGTNGPSVWSEIRSLITTNPPSVPTLASPANNTKVSGPSPLFDWNDSTLPVGVNLDYYQIQVATDNGFTNIVHDNNVAGLANSQDNTSILLPATTYYWRVRAFNTFGSASAWSVVRSVRIKFAGPTPIQPGAGSTVSSLMPTFTWDAVSGATDYTIQVSKSSIFSPLVINQTAANPSYTHTTNLQASTTYYWRVRVKNPTTYGSGDWSHVFTFTTP